MDEITQTLYGAVIYTLDRIQSDPDLHYVAGTCTETFNRLCAAEAAVTGESEEEVRERRSALKFRSGRARLVELKEEVAALRELLHDRDPR